MTLRMKFTSSESCRGWVGCEFLAFLQIHHLRVKLQTSRTQQQEPAVKQQENPSFSSKSLAFFTMFSLQQAHRPAGVGPRSLHPRSRGLQVEWGRSLQLLETNKKTHPLYPKCVIFFQQKTSTPLVYGYMPTPN